MARFTQQWSLHSDLSSLKIKQELLERQLQLLFPDEEKVVEARKHSNLKYSPSSYMEVDVWFPHLGIAFEFQDDYHYVSTWFAPRNPHAVQQRDSTKKIAALSRGLSMVAVPCWWDGSAESLSATINFERPGLLEAQDNTNLIPLNPPLRFFSSARLPDIGELMIASFMYHKDPVILPSHWWMGEKYDGVRCFWHSDRKNIYTRAANIIPIHESFKSFLPPIFADGELWFGRGSFAHTYNLYTDTSDTQWDLLRLVAFDVPAISFQDDPFELRYSLLTHHIHPDSPFAQVVPRVLCLNSSHLNYFNSGIISAGGEGTIMREMNSVYTRGKSSSLFKLKAAQADREGLVVEVLVDGAVKLKLPSDQFFTVPPSDIQLEEGHKIYKGDIVSFSYEFSSRREIPQKAEIYRVRHDMSWEDVVESARKENTGAESANSSMVQDNFSYEKMRDFMIKLARQFNLDPFSSETWYTIPLAAVYNTKEGRMILGKFKGLHSSLCSLFPSISFDPSRFKQSVWTDVANRRRFFEKYAKANGFDPLVPENWYKQRRRKILETKGAISVLSYHGSVSKALIDLFPDIGIQKDKMWPKRAWTDLDQRRKFFEDFARENGFDPLNPDNWYKQSRERMLEKKLRFRALYHHDGSVTQALLELFPNIGLDKDKLSNSSTEIISWYLQKNRRKFFEDYAKKNSFDPLNPDHWHNQSMKRIANAKGIQQVIAYHSGSISKALRDLFPNIGLDNSKFWVKKLSWSDYRTRRKFFETYAKENGFDPLNSTAWYEHKAGLYQVKGTTTILKYHNNSVARALVELFPEVTFDLSRLKITSMFPAATTRRRLFEKYAQENEFDPLIAENWYSHSKLHKRGSFAALLEKGSLLFQDVLMDTFPDIGLDRDMLGRRAHT